MPKTTHKITPQKLALAMRIVKAALRREGIKLSHVRASDVVLMAKELCREYTTRELRIKL